MINVQLLLQILFILPDPLTFDVVKLWSDEAEDNEAVEDHGEAEVGQGNLHDQGGSHTVHLHHTHYTGPVNRIPVWIVIKVSEFGYA